MLALAVVARVSRKAEQPASEEEQSVSSFTPHGGFFPHSTYNGKVVYWFRGDTDEA